MKSSLGITLAFLFLPVVQAFPLNPESIAALPAGDQAGWKAYLERSQTAAAADQSALQAELAKHTFQDPLPAPNGGSPQAGPPEGGYHDAATFNDDAITNILRLLHEAATGKPESAFFDEQRLTSIKAALVKGVSFVVRSQVTLNGVKTGWCAQHDPLTLQPVAARAMGLASLASVETSNMVKFLMTIHHPEPELVSCVSSALQWLETAKITGISRVKREGKTQYEPSPDATEVYGSRFYSLSEGKPIFPGRDGVIYQSYAEMVARNKVGYDYYSTRPGSTVGSSQKKWRKMLASAK